MTKPALSERILMQVEKPLRYIGNEVNMIKKDPDFVGIRFAICFPDVYEIGMSHLGIQILYDMFNRREDVYCERVYSPWPDLHRIMKEQRIPLFTLETQEPVKSFDFLGITLQYEMCYPNILQILDLSGIPLYAKDRTKEDPIVIGGGPCVYNPEPVADFFDLFYIGEGEISYDPLFDLYLEMKNRGSSREEFLHAAAQIPGIYVPSLYEVTYGEDGCIASFRPVSEDIPAVVRKQVVTDPDRTLYLQKPLVPYLQVTQDRVVLEVMRGCIRGCRFCQAGMIYRPLRERSVETAKRTALEMLASTGQDEISISSLSSSDYSGIEELLTFLCDHVKGQGIGISLPSMRIDAFSLDIMSRLQDVKKSSLTFAPEAGSQRMRDVINKGLTAEDILKGSSLAFQGGWNKVKLYFMLGLPTEEDEDRAAIGTLAEQIAECYYDIPKERRNGKCQITVSTSFFVPKPFTPFQWYPMKRMEEFESYASTVKTSIRSQLNQKSIRYNWHSSDVTVIEGILARGDRRLSKALVSVYEKGGIFAAWTDFFDREHWQEAFAENGISADFYAFRDRDENEILPWDFIDAGVSRTFLWREWQRAKEGVVTPNCREACSGCGAAVYPGGVCTEARGGVRTEVLEADCAAREKDCAAARGEDCIEIKKEDFTETQKEVCTESQEEA